MPFHVTVVLVLCFLSFVLIVYMFVYLVACGNGSATDEIAHCRMCLALKDRNYHLYIYINVALFIYKWYTYMLLLFTSVLAIDGIYELIVYIILILLFVLMFRLSVVRSRIVVLSHTD